MSLDKLYMQRCIKLAEKGRPKAFPNPLVGCVIVKNNKIISEGYHKKFGSKHAEIEAISKIKNKETLEGSEIYVNLEPCSHKGKTPACVDEIKKYKFKRIIIGSKDPFQKVNGRGIKKLENFKIKTGCLERECIELNKRFFTNHKKERPYVILKWAQTKNNFMGNANSKERLIISNSHSFKISHKWRSIESAILIGKNTATEDNPFLTTRLSKGKNPIRVILDQNLETKQNLNVFNKEAKTIIVNDKKNKKNNNLHYVKIKNDKNFIKNLLKFLHKQNIYSLIVEGGSTILNIFLKSKIWDEARVFISDKKIKEGIQAPSIKNIKSKNQKIKTDILKIYRNK